MDSHWRNYVKEKETTKGKEKNAKRSGILSKESAKYMGESKQAGILLIIIRANIENI